MPWFPRTSGSVLKRERFAIEDNTRRPVYDYEGLPLGLSEKVYIGVEQGSDTPPQYGRPWGVGRWFRPSFYDEQYGESSSINEERRLDEWGKYSMDGPGELGPGASIPPFLAARSPDPFGVTPENRQNVYRGSYQTYSDMMDLVIPQPGQS